MYQRERGHTTMKFKMNIPACEINKVFVKFRYCVLVSLDQKDG